jgi:hypothetical protein
MEASPRPAFELSKWYLDAVGEDGEVFIGYRASLRWRRLAVSYAATLTGGAHEPRTRSTARSEEQPVLRMGALSWTSQALDVEGSWRCVAASETSRTLYETPSGAVVWRCLMPSAKAEARQGARVVRGLGYAEHLSMTLPPWRLPIDTLRWGRFLSPEHSVVWIDWERESARRTWVFVNGAEVQGEVTEEDVFLEGGRVSLPQRDRLLLRSGRLSYLLRNLPLPLSFSRRVLAIHETKWRTRGVLECAGVPPAEGWAIHEVVRFRP